MAARNRPLLTDQAWRQITRFNGAIELIDTGVKQKRIDKARRKYDGLFRPPRFGLFGGGNLTLEGFQIPAAGQVRYILRCSCGRFTKAGRMDLLCEAVQCCEKCTPALSTAELEAHAFAMVTNGIGGSQLAYCRNTPNLNRLITLAEKKIAKVRPTLKRKQRSKT
jgi:hypothetical protein